MKHGNNRNTPHSSDPMLALQEFYPDHADGALAIADRHEALQAYLAHDDGFLAKIPAAFDAHVYRRHFDFD